MKRIPLHYQILVALLLAVLVGSTTTNETRLLGLNLEGAFSFVGDLFLRALKMLVMPLIASSIIAGIASVGQTQGFGRLGLKTGGYYMATSLLAILIGLFAVNGIQPGVVDGMPAKDRIGLSADVASVTEKVAGRSSKDIVEVFLRMVPENVLGDASRNEMLGVIFFSLLFGYFLTRISEKPRRTLETFWQGVYEVMLMMTDWVMMFAPIGVFALAAKVIMSTGFAVLAPLLSFVVTVLLALAAHSLLALPLLLKFVGRVRPERHYKAMLPAIFMAFSTASSSATLPLTMECVAKAGVSRRVTSFTLPLGATINMDGTALYECVAAIFIAQAYGVELGVAQQFTIVAIALLTSIGVAGIPAASLVAITLILTTMGLPMEGVGLILAVDRLLDMCRTAVNVFSDSCAAVIVAKSEGETDILETRDSSSEVRVN